MAAIAPGLIAPPSNGTLINGVAHFVTTSKPTVRVDGSALVTGDRWYKSDDGTDWFWNGTYWLSTQIFYGGGQANTTSTGGNYPTNNLTFAQAPFNYSFFVQDFHIKYAILTANTSNFWQAGVVVWQCTNNTIGGGSTYFKTINTSTGGATTYVTETIPLNVVLTNSETASAYTITGRAVKTGTPSDLSFVARISYRLIAP